MNAQTSLVTVVVLLLAGCEGGVAHGGYLYSRPAISFDLPQFHQQPLTVLAEAPFSIDQQLVPVPLLTVPKDRIRVMQEGSKHQVELPDKGMMPAVRVVLRRPMMVPASAGASAVYRIPFPATFTVLHGGLRVPLRVGSLLAPVPSGPLALRIPVQVLYAVPVQPFALRPYFPSLAVPQRRPVLSPPTVTVLDFPEAVATPGSLLYQPPLVDAEVGNREPPQAIAPAGIVQSTAPQPNLSVFINSKESPLLQVLRDEAANNAAPDDSGRFDDDDDAIVVIAD